MTRTINFKGQEIGISFGMATMREFSELMNLSILDMANLMDKVKIGDWIVLMRIAMKNGARKLNQTFDSTITIEQMEDYIDDNPKFFKQAIEIYMLEQLQDGDVPAPDIESPGQVDAAQGSEKGK